jgi:hypothetical protein
MVRDLEAIMSQPHPHIQSSALLPPNHDIRHLVRQVLFLAAEVVDRDRTPHIMSQKVVQLLVEDYLSTRPRSVCRLAGSTVSVLRRCREGGVSLVDICARSVVCTQSPAWTVDTITVERCLEPPGQPISLEHQRFALRTGWHPLPT